MLRLERRPVQVDPMQEYELLGVYSWGKGLFRREAKPGAELGNFRFFAIQPSDLVLSNIQAWEGAIGVARERDAAAIGTHRFLTYVPVDGRIDTTWAKWFFLSEPGMTLIRMASPGTTMRNRTLAIDRFEALEIPLQPIDEQRSVAARLDHVEAAAEDVASRASKASVLSDALAVSIASRPDLDEASKRGRGWRRVRLGSVMSPAKSPEKVDVIAAYPNVGVYSFGRGLFEKPPIDGATTSATTLNRITAGQFIYSRLFAFEGAYAWIPLEFDGFYVSNEFPAFDPDPAALEAQWLATVLRSPDRWAELGGRSKGLGVRRQRVPVEAVLDYELWLPPIAEQRAMVEAIQESGEPAAHRRSVIERTDALLPAALNEAFAGLS